MSNTMKYPLCAVLLAACSQVMGAELQVRISNADPAAGIVYFALFDSEMNYESRTVRAAAMSREGDARPSAVFAGLAPGNYAVTVFQDTNGNRRLDTNLVGIPLEPYGFSQNAVGNMGRPEFAAAAVALAEDGESLTIEIELRQQP